MMDAVISLALIFGSLITAGLASRFDGGLALFLGALLTAAVLL